MSLVTCAELGNDLTKWLENATAEEIKALQEALGVDKDQLAAIFKDCEGNPQLAGAALVTCRAMQEYVAAQLVALQLVYDDTSTIKFAGGGGEDSPLSADVQLSADSGNQLQERDDGLYYGMQAPPDTRNLYVDPTTGDDSNTGARASPMKTLEAAALKATEGTSRFVHLHEGKTHQINQYVNVKGGTLYLSPYGTQFDAALAAYQVGGPEPHGVLAAAGLLPKVRTHRGLIRVVGSTEYLDARSFVFTGSATLEAFGIEIQVQSVDPALADLPRASSNQMFHAASVDSAYVRLAYGKVRLEGDDPLRMSGSITNLFFGVLVMTPDSDQTEYIYRIDSSTSKWIPAYPALSLSVQDGMAQANVAKFISGAQKNTNPVYNLTTNIDPDLID